MWTDTEKFSWLTPRLATNISATGSSRRNENTHLDHAVTLSKYAHLVQPNPGVFLYDEALVKLCLEKCRYHKLLDISKSSNLNSFCLACRNVTEVPSDHHPIKLVMKIK